MVLPSARLFTFRNLTFKFFRWFRLRLADNFEGYKKSKKYEKNAKPCCCLVFGWFSLRARTCFVDPTNNQLQLYPNPTRYAVMIRVPATALGHLSIYTADGRLLLQKRTNSDITTLDCSQWPSGLYLLRWEGEHQVLAQKLLVD